jgi:sugar O-acyltransferase (sialic acid O-acetyltransferase NeuD family)
MGCITPQTAQHAWQALPEGERVVIVGTGETAAIAFEYFSRDSPHEVVAFSTEPKFLTTEVYHNLPVIPLDELANVYSPTETRAYVAVSYIRLNRVRRRLYYAVKAAGFDCVSYVSSNAVVASNVEVGENSFIQEFVVIQRGARIGNNVFLGSGTSVGYGSVIGADCYSSAHATVGHSCTVGSGSFLGAACCVTDGRSVAQDCAIGAGAVIRKDTAVGQVYLGNPARPLPRDSFETFGLNDD